MGKLALIVHLVAFLALLGAYLSLTLTGHDGNTILGAMGGQGFGAAIQEGTSGR